MAPPPEENNETGTADNMIRRRRRAANRLKRTASAKHNTTSTTTIRKPSAKQRQHSPCGPDPQPRSRAYIDPQMTWLIAVIVIVFIFNIEAILFLQRRHHHPGDAYFSSSSSLSSYHHVEEHTHAQGVVVADPPLHLPSTTAATTTQHQNDADDISMIDKHVMTAEDLTQPSFTIAHFLKHRHPSSINVISRSNITLVDSARTWFARGSMRLLSDDREARKLAYEDIAHAVYLAPDSEEYSKALSALSRRMLVEWILEGKGAQVNGVELSNEGEDSVRSPHRKGIRSTSPKAKGELVVRIPRSRMLTLDDVLASSIGQTILSAGVKHSLHSMFGVFLAHERHNPDSHWTPYLRVLPSSFDHMPVFADEEILEELKGSSAIERLGVRKNGLDGEFQSMSTLFPLMKKEDLIWGLHVSMSRAAGVEIEGKDTAAIIPFLNEMKHTSGKREVRGHFDDSENGFEIRAEQDIEAGHGEYLRNYGGQKSAFIFYQDYGFVPHFNSGFDDVQISFESPAAPGAAEESELETEKANVIGTWTRKFLLTRSLNNESARKVLSFLRLQVANTAEWKRADVYGRDPTSIGPLSLRNEIAALRELRGAIVRTLNGFDTTLKEDQMLLDHYQKQMRFEMQMAIRMRLSEKRVAHDLLHQISKRVLKQQIKIDQLTSTNPSTPQTTKPEKPPIRTETKRTAYDDDDNVFESTRSWLVNGGAHIGEVEVRRYTEDNAHRGLHARSNIASGTTIMSVPLSHMLTSDMALRSSAAAKEARDHHLLHSLSEHSLMAVFLLEQAAKDTSSRWAVFLRSMPSSFSSIAAFYSDEERALLTGSMTLALLQKVKQGFEKEFASVSKAAPETMKAFTKEAFITALNAVNTRNFRVYLDAQKSRKMHVMVPFVDMMDHAQHFTTEWDFDVNQCTFNVKATSDMIAGDPVYTSYGDKANAQLFVIYGFALENNANDVAQFWFDCGSVGRAFVLPGTFSPINDRPLKECLKYLRIALNDDEEVIMNMLQESAQATLEGFETSIEEDEQMLDRHNQDMHFHVRTAILVRLSEKRVCQFWIEATKKLVDVLYGRLNIDDLSDDIAAFIDLWDAVSDEMADENYYTDDNEKEADQQQQQQQQQHEAKEEQHHQESSAHHPDREDHGGNEVVADDDVVGSGQAPAGVSFEYAHVVAADDDIAVAAS